MVVGLLLILLGALAIVAALLTATGSHVELLGFGVSAVGLFLVGLASGVAILWGIGLAKWGTKRSLRHRRESRRLDALSEKLDRREAEQHDERDDHRDSQRDG